MAYETHVKMAMQVFLSAVSQHAHVFCSANGNVITVAGELTKLEKTLHCDTSEV